MPCHAERSEASWIFSTTLRFAQNDNSGYFFIGNTLNSIYHLYKISKSLSKNFNPLFFELPEKLCL
jgi:hypothetical protein